MELLNIGAILAAFGAIIGLYVWVFKQISEVKSMIQRHENKAAVHVDSDNLVDRKVCELQVLRFNEKIDETNKKIDSTKRQVADLTIKVDTINVGVENAAVEVAALHSKIEVGFGEVKTLLQKKDDR